MYSNKINEAYYYNSFTYFIDDTEVNLMELPKSKQELVLATTKKYFLGNYSKVNQQNKQFTTQYEVWLLNYLNKQFNLKGQTVTVKKQKNHFTEQHTFVPESASIIFTYHKND